MTDQPSAMCALQPSQSPFFQAAASACSILVSSSATELGDCGGAGGCHEKATSSDQRPAQRNATVCRPAWSETRKARPVEGVADEYPSIGKRDTVSVHVEPGGAGGGAPPRNEPMNPGSRTAPSSRKAFTALTRSTGCWALGLRHSTVKVTPPWPLETSAAAPSICAAGAHRGAVTPRATTSHERRRA